MNREKICNNLLILCLFYLVFSFGCNSNTEPSEEEETFIKQISGTVKLSPTEPLEGAVVELRFYYRGYLNQKAECVDTTDSEGTYSIACEISKNLCSSEDSELILELRIDGDGGPQFYTNPPMECSEEPQVIDFDF